MPDITGFQPPDTIFNGFFLLGLCQLQLWLKELKYMHLSHLFYPLCCLSLTFAVLKKTNQVRPALSPSCGNSACLKGIKFLYWEQKFHKMLLQTLQETSCFVQKTACFQNSEERISQGKNISERVWISTQKDHLTPNP